MVTGRPEGKKVTKLRNKNGKWPPKLVYVSVDRICLSESVKSLGLSYDGAKALLCHFLPLFLRFHSLSPSVFPSLFFFSRKWPYND